MWKFQNPTGATKQKMEESQRSLRESFPRRRRRRDDTPIESTKKRKSTATGSSLPPAKKQSRLRFEASQPLVVAPPVPRTSQPSAITPRGTPSPAIAPKATPPSAIAPKDTPIAPKATQSSAKTTQSSVKATQPSAISPPRTTQHSAPLNASQHPATPPRTARPSVSLDPPATPPRTSATPLSASALSPRPTQRPATPQSRVIRPPATPPLSRVLTTPPRASAILPRAIRPLTTPPRGSVTPPKADRSQCGCPGTPEPLSRGQMMVAMARQKAGSTTPVSRNRPQGGQSGEKVITARRRLLDFYDHSEVPAKPVREGDDVAEEKGPTLGEFKYLEFSSPTKKSQSSSRTLTTQFSAQHPPLPSTYRLLSERFRCVDTVAAMLHNRGEACSFGKLKKAVQEMTRRQFSEKHLGQIKSVWPAALSYHQVKMANMYQLTVEPNLTAVPAGGPSSSSLSSLTPSGLVQRRRVFNQRLGELVRGHHQQFLTSRQPPLAIPEREVMRWHVDFPLESVPEVEPAELPSPPVAYTSVSSVSAVLSDLVPSSDDAVNEEVIEDTPVHTDPALKGVSADLISKIRAKEAARARAAITRDSATEKKLQKLSLLPDIARVLSSYFACEKKPAMAYDRVVQKLLECRSEGQVVTEQCIELLREVCPQWISFPKVQKKQYIKINRKLDFSVVLRTIEQKRNGILNT